MTRFTPADDLMHDLSGIAYGRESLLWTVPLPEHGLLVFVYVWRVPETGRFGHFVSVAGDDGGRALVLDETNDVELDGQNFDDCAIGSLRIRQPEPLTVAELSYETGELAYSARFEGLHAPFSWHENEGGCPPWAAADRFEQSCRVTGHLRVAGREVQIDGYGHRDHSWGARDWRALQHWKWINAAAGDDLSLHAWVSFALGERQVNGYVNREGVVIPLVDVQATATLDDRMLHETVTARLLDAEGGETLLVGRRAAIWQMPIRHLYLNEAAMSATIDGRAAIAHVELGWPQAYVNDYLQAEAA
jgi:hypothetical protein